MRILLVESDPFEATIYARELKLRAFEVDVVSDGETCLARARGTKPRAIILDLRLPRHDGFSVLHRLRSDAETAHIPVVILARSVQSRDLERASLSDSCPFFIKPYAPPDAIAHRVEELVAKTA